MYMSGIEARGQPDISCQSLLGNHYRFRISNVSLFKKLNEDNHFQVLDPQRQYHPSCQRVCEGPCERARKLETEDEQHVNKRRWRES